MHRFRFNNFSWLTDSDEQLHGIFLKLEEFQTEYFEPLAFEWTAYDNDTACVTGSQSLVSERVWNYGPWNEFCNSGMSTGRKNRWSFQLKMPTSSGKKLESFKRFRPKLKFWVLLRMLRIVTVH